MSDAEPEEDGGPESLERTFRRRRRDGTGSRRCFCCCRRPLRCLAYTVHVVDLLLGVTLSFYGVIISATSLLAGPHPIPTAAVCCSGMYGAAMLLSALCPLDATSRFGTRCLHLSAFLSPLIVVGELSAVVILLVRRRDVLDYLARHADALGLTKSLVRWLNDNTTWIYAILVLLGTLELCRFLMLLRITRHSARHHASESDEERERRVPLLGRRRRRSMSLVGSVDADEEGQESDVEVPFEERHRLVRNLQDFVPGETADEGGGGDGGGIFFGGFRFWGIAGGDSKPEASQSADLLDDDSSLGFAPVDQDLKGVGVAESNWWSLPGKMERDEKKDTESTNEGHAFV